MLRTRKSFPVLAAFASLALLSAGAEAKLFTNKFIEFQLPEKWECALDGSEWLCQSTDEQKKRDAIIILVAKVRKEGVDELDAYKVHLAKKQSYEAPNGQRIESDPRYVKEIQVSGRPWIDALHLQGELPDFFTRYLATVEADLGILATFSVRKDKFTEYTQDIENMVKSLKAFRTPGPLVDPQALSSEGDGKDMPGSVAGGEPGAAGACPPDQTRDLRGACADKQETLSPTAMKGLLLAGTLALIAFAVFFLRRRRGPPA